MSGTVLPLQTGVRLALTTSWCELSQESAFHSLAIGMISIRIRCLPLSDESLYHCSLSLADGPNGVPISELARFEFPLSSEGNNGKGPRSLPGQ